MKAQRLGIAISIVSGLLVVAFVVWDSQRTSPGPISAVHVQDPKLAGNQCAVCHGGLGQSMESACASCHAEVEKEVREKKGFHGTLATDASACGTCHPEHHGADFAIAGPRSFALAGIRDRERYAHERLGFELAGKHVDLSCKRCHEHADDVLLVAGCKRFLGKEQRCAACHEDPHAGKLPDCRACHGETAAFAAVAAFRHPETFALTGAHAKPRCVDCHPKESAFAVEASDVAAGMRAAPGQPPRAARAPRTCVECHESPHASTFLAAVASALAQQAGATCGTCHATVHDSFRSPPATITSEQHALAGFALDAPHDKATCAQCHSTPPKDFVAPEGSPARRAFAALHAGRKADECAACHVDVHRGQFASGAFAGQGCLACHDARAFQPPAFDVAKHARTAFALTGKHQTAACETCHTKPAGEEPRTFHGTSSACESCHTDAHSGFFERVASASLPPRPAGTPPPGCADCHTTSTFRSTDEKPFDHARSTGFALAGRHAVAACESCHPRSAAPDFSRRTFGRVAALHAGNPSRCDTCHADAHAGAFASVARHEGESDDCAACHTDVSFAAQRERFDHARWTGFALVGAHARAACETCHPASATADANGRRFGWARELPRVAAHARPGDHAVRAEDCSACHADVHAGLFDGAGRPGAVGNATGCARCHDNESFHVQPAAFDHARWTGYALDGAHARAACQACHVPARAADADGRAFGRALGTECAACHDDPHVGQFAREGRTDCARCHADAASFERTTFDHQRDSRFHLDAAHVKVACAACHLPTPVPDSRPAVRYKPLGTECGDCHSPSGGGR